MPLLLWGTFGSEAPSEPGGGIDTAYKRRSVLGVGVIALRAWPPGTGDIGASDRKFITFLYSGAETGGEGGGDLGSLATAAGRRAAIGLDLHAIKVWPLPDGDIDTVDDRKHMAAKFITLAVTGTQITPTVGSLSLTGQTPIRTVPTSITPTVGGLTLAGVAPIVIAATAIIPTTGSLSLSGVAGSVGWTVTPTVGSLTLAGVAPGVERVIALPAPSGQLVITGNAPTVRQTYSIQVPAGSLTLTPNLARIKGRAILIFYT
jgi:hypothetical protein